MFDLLSREYLEWVIDVDAVVGLYIGQDNSPTELLLSLCDVFLAKGKAVTHFGIRTSDYEEASHILRCGYLFARMEELESEEANVDHFVAQARIPIYLNDR
jgi:hypothetical protein